MICIVAAMLNSCLYGPEEPSYGILYVRSDQYVHMYYIKNDSEYNLNVETRDYDKRATYFSGVYPGYYHCVKMIVNTSETVDENTIIWDNRDEARLIISQPTVEDEYGRHTKSKIAAFTPDSIEGPYWTDNYTPIPFNMEEMGITSFYFDIKKVDERGHAKAYVLSVTEEYLDQFIDKPVVDYVLE